MKEFAIFFDLDDTLTNLTSSHADIFNILFKKYDLNIPHCEVELRQELKNRNITEAFWKDFNTLDNREKFMEEKKIFLRDEVHTTLEYLQNKHDLFVVTNTPKSKADDALTRFDIKKYFTEIFYPHNHTKPDTRILNGFNYKVYKNITVIGDGKTDLLLAKEMGADFILLRHEKNQHIKEITKTIKCISELKKLF